MQKLALLSRKTTTITELDKISHGFGVNWLIFWPDSIAFELLISWIGLSIPPLPVCLVYYSIRSTKGKLTLREWTYYPIVIVHLETLMASWHTGPQIGMLRQETMETIMRIIWGRCALQSECYK
jgi:hypothetical protein